MQYEKITNDGGVDHNKNSNTSRFCEAGKFWFFVNKSFNDKDHARNACHNLLMIAFLLYNIAVLNYGNVFYRYILMGISKHKGLKRLNNANNLGQRGIV